MFGKSQEIADLQAKVEALTGERDSLASAALTHEAAITALTAERDDANARVLVAQEAANTAQAAVAAAEASATARIAEFESAMQGRIDAAVISAIASAGVGVIAKDPTAAANGDPQKPDLSALKGIEKARAALASKQPALN